jgi:hypothetical protein
MEDPETQDKPAAITPSELPLTKFAIQAHALERAGVPRRFAEIISRAGGSGGIQKFIINEANDLWNDPHILGQVWHGVRLWFLIKFLLFTVTVVRVLPALLLGVFLLGVVVVIGLCIAAANRDTTVVDNTAIATATVPYHNATIDLSAVAEVQTGTKLTYTGYAAPVTGEVTDRSIDSVTIKWEYDATVRRYSSEQLARDLASGRIVINRD